MKQQASKILLTAMFFLGTILSITSACAEDKSAMLAEGGRLYDNWWQEIGLMEPSGTHPAYPANGKKSGATTWRCKECHGWDYRGREGAYGKGGHFTNILGIQKYAGKPLKDIIAILKDRTHQYDRVMLDYGLERIALFVSQGQIDMRRYINSKKYVADQARGRAIYERRCVFCHGSDGRARNFKDRQHPEYIGTLANANPWEALHKIRYGQPGTSMPAMQSKISVQEQVDLLRYMQTLPVK